MKYYAIYDRKSPRHNWMLYCVTTNYNRFVALCDYQFKVLKGHSEKNSGWDKAQLSYITGDEHRFTTTLPKNIEMEKTWTLQDQINL